jgi:hypothetical protein
MKIGYSAWGFVGDGVVDSPDGGRLTRALLIEHLLNENYDIVWLQQNRDVDDLNKPLFSQDKEYFNMQRQTLCKLQYDIGFPNIDILFLEWRWIIPGRNHNVSKTSSNYTPDYDRQNELLEHYIKTSTRIIIWDKDEKLTDIDELWLKSNRKWPYQIEILSPAIYPITQHFIRKTLLFPCDLQSIKGTRVNKHYQHLIGYVGSQYERDEQVYKYINPFSFKYPHQVLFVGNWIKYPEIAKRNDANFPCIKFANRVLPREMGNIYRQCLSTVLLCKSNYADHCHITQRIHEVAANGVIAIGLKEQRGIEQFVNKDLIVSDSYDLIQVVNMLNEMRIEKRQELLDENIDKLELFDINNVMKKLIHIFKTQE